VSSAEPVRQARAGYEEHKRDPRPYL
jgi:hypothetical protein